MSSSAGERDRWRLAEGEPDAPESGAEQTGAIHVHDERHNGSTREADQQSAVTRPLACHPSIKLLQKVG